MSAMNRHAIQITGQTLREISERAAGIFDKFFAREIDWEVTTFVTVANTVELQNGVGEITHSEVSSWSARIEAEAKGIHIGAQKTQEAAMFFKPLGS